MSDKVRYFQGVFSGHIYRRFPGQNQESSEGLAEVQVVPLDAIVIRRDELPEVTVENGRAVANGAEDPYSTRLDANPGWAWHYAINAIAVSEYLREHPPVDEAQVKAIASLLKERHWTFEAGRTWDATATDMYRAGVRVEPQA